MFNKRRVSITLTTAVAVSTLIASGGVAATGDEVAQPDQLGALAAVESFSAAETAILDDVAEVETTSTGSAAVDAHINRVQVVVPTEASDAITLSAEGGATLAISLPEASTTGDAEVLETGIVSFDSGTFSTVPVVKDDGSVQVATVLDSEVSPSTYQYDITSTSGVSLEVTADGLVLITEPRCILRSRGASVGARCPGA